VRILGQSTNPDRENAIRAQSNDLRLPGSAIAITSDLQRACYQWHIDCNPDRVAELTVAGTNARVMKPRLQTWRQFEVGLPDIFAARFHHQRHLSPASDH